jgi:hypothetical protein
MRRASMVGLAMPVTEAKKMAEMSAAVRPSGASARAMQVAELNGGGDPLVVGGFEADQRGVGLERQDEVAVSTPQLACRRLSRRGLGELALPAVAQRLGDLSLRIAMGGNAVPTDEMRMCASALSATRLA